MMVSRLADTENAPVGIKRSFDEPDETVEFGGVLEQLISLGGLTVSRSVQPVGWDWHTHFQPLVGGTWCQAHHVGAVIAGHQAVRLMDGTELEFGPGDLYDIPPGHVGWTIGDEDSVAIEWSGMRQWVGNARTNRVLASLLFSDIVDSTAMATSLGDARWHDLLSVHYQQAQEAIDRFGGRRITTTGDGMLASFDAAAAAVECALALRQMSGSQEIDVRIGVHVGEVELAGDDIRGITVHEAARVMAAAGAGEIFATEQVRLLCQGSGLVFEDAGEFELRGVPDPWRLYRVDDG
jgi:class 3 adenylate cyclase